MRCLWRWRAGPAAITLRPMTTHERPFGRCLEDFTPGDVLKHWPGKTITEYDDHLFCMITMNHHPLHTNDWFAAESVQGRNVVVGNLVYSLVLGMSVPDVSGAAIANLEVETLQHKFPTFHGDTIHAETRVLEVKESKSKPDRGIVTVETKGFNQDGNEVCYFKRKVLVWKKDAAPERKRPYDGVEVHPTGLPGCGHVPAVARSVHVNRDGLTARRPELKPAEVRGADRQPRHVGRDARGLPVRNGARKGRCQLSGGRSGLGDGRVRGCRGCEVLQRRRVAVEERDEGRERERARGSGDRGVRRGLERGGDYRELAQAEVQRH